VLSIWSLNHVSQPDRMIREAARVLRPGGRFPVILDDVRPRWGDIARVALQTRDIRGTTTVLARRLRAVVSGWPMQTDHIRIRESDLQRWITPACAIARRFWVGSYLTYELRRSSISPAARRCAL
jgi:SAM-dependent methyltransferase